MVAAMQGVPLESPYPSIEGEADFVLLSRRVLASDGPDSGLDAHDLVRRFAGHNALETPDLYANNHPEVRHIVEDTDPTVGPHFVFTIHRDVDQDRDRVYTTDRQRNEIKAYAGSSADLKGFEGQTFVYRWRMRIGPDMEVSTRFTHFFQLKAVGGDDRQPIVTLSGAERRGRDGIELRHSPAQGGAVLARADWSEVAGEWLDVYCRASFSEAGNLRLIVSRMSDGAVLLNVDERDLDLWRGQDATHFVRPKWGIYRSLLDLDSLRAEEEVVRFANLEVSRVAAAGEPEAGERQNR